ncbi:MAG: cobyrinate a,c-diamide synthase [Pseudomonadota bacterium]
MTRSLMIAAPASGVGKTTVTLALLRALRNRGVDVRGAKSGPDYIDPAFHEAATGAPSINLDAWASRPESLAARALSQGGDLTLVEAAMGLLDGAPDGSGSAADLAAALGAPVVMVVDAAKASRSAALAAAGARALRPDLEIAGVILNRVGSSRHARIAAAGMEAAGIHVFGVVPRDAILASPARHLGLVQARERPDLDGFIEAAARLVARSVDVAAVAAAARPLSAPNGAYAATPPLGQRIAVARDDAFAFVYPHHLADWRAEGAEITFFSPLADEGPDPGADAVFLPGGYPELHGERLALAAKFRAGLAAQSKRALVYGECGGYMALGEVLIDEEGRAHRMAGLLPLVTTFARRKLALGYRRLRPLGGPFADRMKGPLAGHEFHYARSEIEGAAPRLFGAWDADGERIGPIGLSAGNVCGSFAHVIGPHRL